MKKAWILSLMFFCSSQAHALDYSDVSLMFTDAPFRPADAAGISVLYSLGAVGGYPDGSFQPNRTLNRAEFLKIVLLTDPTIRISASDADNCFPDVSAEDWFSRYVCLGLKRGIIQGYPDGMFHPDRNVNYVEALKILGEMYGYTAYSEPDDPWYVPYVQAAKNHKTELPINLAFDRALTRGQMARLAAAYRAESEGELEYYRSAEKGNTVVVPAPTEEGENNTHSGSVTEEEPETQTGSTVEEEVVDEAEPSNYVATGAIYIPYPAKSGILLLGSRSNPVADAKFAVRENDVLLKKAKVILRKEVKSLRELYLVDQAGRGLITLKLTPGYDEKEEWSAQISPDAQAVLQGGETPIFAIEAKIRSGTEGGFSAEQLEVEKIVITVQDPSDGFTYEIVGQSTHYPLFQTAIGQITGIQNVAGTGGRLFDRNNVRLASFAFTGSTASIAPLRVKNLILTPDATFGVGVSGWNLTTEGGSAMHECSVDSATKQVNCVNIPDSMGTIAGGSRIIHVNGTINLGGVGSGRTLQVNLIEDGAVNVQGSVRWTDGSGEFNSLPMSPPVANGPIWTIEE